MTDQTQPKGVTQTSQPTKRPTVLLVEDDPLLVKMYNVKFTSEGFQVLTAPDGEAGLKMALNEKVDLIILDIMMPKLSGIDLLERLRQDPRGKNTPVIILTNLSEDEEKKKTLELGVKEYIVKANLTPGQLVEKVREYLGR